MPIIINNQFKLTNQDQVERNLRIRNKRGEIVPFKSNPVQQIYWQKRTRRNLWLKPRQKGLSKIIDADQLVDCALRTTNAVVISHEKEATKRLFAAVDFFVQNAKTKPRVSIYSKSEMRFPETGSYYYIGTAGQKAFGRGDTISRAHLSEAAFYDDLDRILAGISEAAEYGTIDIETTPNGRGAFYDLWQKAKAGKSPYTAIFIPWFIDDEYSVKNMTEQDKQGLSASVQEMFAIPENKFEIQKDEQELIKKAKRDYNVDITIDQLKWRRYKIWDKGELFFQEYPEDDVSCFLQSGRSVFSKIIRDESKQIPLDDLESWNASDDEKEALKGRRLYAGIDGAEGTLTGDAHCFAVIDVVDDKATTIFEYTTNEPVDKFWRKVKAVMDEYDIILGIEKNGVGLAHIGKAKELGVPFISWTTSAANRPKIILDLEEAYRKGDLIETYSEAEDEARNMEYTESNRAEAKKGKHDDRIFARAIAWQMRNRREPSVEWL